MRTRSGWPPPFRKRCSASGLVNLNLIILIGFGTPVTQFWGNIGQRALGLQGGGEKKERVLEANRMARFSQQSLPELQEELTEDSVYLSEALQLMKGA